MLYCVSGIGRYANLTDVTSRTVALGNTLAAGTVSYRQYFSGFFQVRAMERFN